ncbi:MAG: S46 family peptidase [Bacteroidales bacterium]|nr:S46 family peptidase [Bacteroidales bacterium]
MRKKTNLLCIALMMLVMGARADEGMWLPYSINGQNLADMQRLGCKLTAEQIFSFNQPSLKDAIVQFGGGCTGELISPEGLLLTNHHCGLGQVQAHSSVEHDYLQDGFWARSKAEELPNEGLTVSFLAYIEDVTTAILKGVTDGMSEADRAAKISENGKKLTIERKGKRDVEVEIVPFYHGNQYILFEYDVYKDVRLVACPPWGIGKFGADTDNWTWPRHKGDFCIFRVYTAPDGSPAKYSKDNIPMKSKHYLPISLKGVQPGDYTMILGYPGSTDRYSASGAVKNIIELEGPAIVDCRTTKLEQYRKHMDADPAVFIQYASKQASVSNYWKYYIGQVKQLKRNKVYEKRLEQEQAFRQWAAQDKNRKAKYDGIFDEMNKYWNHQSKYQKALIYHREAGWHGGEAVTFALRFRPINRAIEEKLASHDKIVANAQNMKASVEDFFKDYNKALDRDVTIALLNLFYKDVAPDQLPTTIKKVGDKNHGDFTAFVDNAFAKSVLVDKSKLEAWMENPKSLSKDPIYALMYDILQSYWNLDEQAEKVECGRANRLYMEGLMEMQKDRNFYPDANFTMRLTYGSVQDCKPADGVTYNYITTLDGVMAKYKPGNWEFDVPQDLIKLWENHDYGRYANENGDLVVNFITTNDITGGNSGSPVIDANGNLVGLAFDGNWEAMSGDIAFENEVQRTICMDMRYLLFIIDKMANAQNLMQELKIVQ